jgi:hypothetical protein
VLGYLAPFFVLWVTLTFWRRHDATGIDLRRDRKNLKRRSCFRAGIRWPVSVVTMAGSIQGRTRNVSASGVTLITLQPLVRGEIVPLTLSAPDRVLRVRGEVIWIDIFYPARSRTPHKAIGILFREISQGDTDFLGRSIDVWHEAEERRRAESRGKTLLAKWREASPVYGVLKPVHAGRLHLEGGFRSLRQRFEGALCQAGALFHRDALCRRGGRSRRQEVGSQASALRVPLR